MDKKALEPLRPILEAAAHLWGLDSPALFHRRVENFVYFSQIGEREVVLRLTEPSRRSVGAIGAELDWQVWMKERGAGCASPISSRSGRFVEEIEADGMKLYACLFERAKGAPLRKKEDFTPSMMREWGRMLARFHDLTSQYGPGPGIEQRLDWRADFHHSIASVLLEEEESMPGRLIRRYLDWMARLPRERDSYGLVHTDLHNGNFLVEEGKITAFDFDDSCYHWFAYDLAVPLFYLRQFDRSEKIGLDLPKLEEAYLAGYRELMPLEDSWAARLEAFVAYRALLMHGWSTAQIQSGKLSAASLNWCEEYRRWFLANSSEEVALT